MFGLSSLASQLDSSGLLVSQRLLCNLTEFIFPNSILVDSLEFSLYNIISSANRDNFIPSFQSGCLLFHFLA